MVERTPFTNPHEDAFAQWAIEQGWTVTKKGWPDFMCRRGDEIMAVEVKGGKDFVRPEQFDTIRDLRAVGFPTFVWSPEKGLTEPARMELAESVATLRARVSELERILMDFVNREDATEPSKRQRPEPYDFTDDEKFGLRAVSKWCFRRHKAHEAMVAGQQMAVCVWLVLLSGRYDLDKAASILALDPIEASGMLNKALAHKRLKIEQRRYGLTRPEAA
jgi:hypothetical protein